MERKITMSACWMLVILLGCRLSWATQSKNACPCNVELVTVCVPASEEALMPCQNVTVGEMMFHLLRGQEMISNVTCSRRNGTLSCGQPHTRVGVRVKDNTLVSFVLAGLNKSSQGVYRCEGTVIYPPPLTKVATTMRVFVAENQCKCGKDCGNRNGNPGYEQYRIWIGVVILLGVYSITVTVVAIVSWVRSRNTDSQSDYMNTTPRAPKDRKKRRGVQNPTPRYM